MNSLTIVAVIMGLSGLSLWASATVALNKRRQSKNIVHQQDIVGNNNVVIGGYRDSAIKCCPTCGHSDVVKETVVIQKQLTSSDIKSGNFVNTTISNVELNNSALAKSNFTNVKFSNVDFRNSDFKGCTFTNVKFTNCDLPKDSTQWPI